jgi:hypothetical protein
MSQPIITLAEARSKGLTRYFSGKSCKQGHISERYVSTHNCLECLVANDARRYALHHTPEISKRKHIWTKYRLRPDDVLRMYEKQKHQCGVCLKDLSLSEVNIDHDHVTNKVRGIVCFHCNLMLGHARDNVETLARAITYLKQSA